MRERSERERGEAAWREAKDLLTTVTRKTQLPGLLHWALAQLHGYPPPRQGLSEAALALGCEGWVVDALVAWEGVAEAVEGSVIGGWRELPEAERRARAERAEAQLGAMRAALDRGPRLVRVGNCKPRDEGAVHGGSLCPVVREDDRRIVARVDGQEVAFDRASGWRVPHDKRKHGLRLAPEYRRKA
jgi:hypothetical protein